MHSNSHPALLLFAHGARDPNWARPFQAVAQRVQDAQPDLPVQLAFLEFMTPDLPQGCAALVAKGCTRVDVVPLFLGAGGHVRKDLPALLAQMREQHPGVTFMLHPAVGEHALVVEAMAAAAVASTRATASGPAVGEAAEPASVPAAPAR